MIPIADCDALAERFFALAGGSLNDVRKANDPTGQWACTRCGLLWADQRRPPKHWYDRDLDESESPHVCPECGSYAYTHQY